MQYEVCVLGEKNALKSLTTGCFSALKPHCCSKYNVVIQCFVHEVNENLISECVFTVLSFHFLYKFKNSCTVMIVMSENKSINTI